MTDNGIQPTTPALAAKPAVASPANPPSTLKMILKGPNGLRAGWRILLYLLLTVGISATIRFIRHHFFPATVHPPQLPFQPGHEIFQRYTAFFIAAFAAWVMSRFERRSWGEYGLPARSAFRGRFWFGAFWGVAALSLVMAALYAVGVYRIDNIALVGTAIWKYGPLWAIAFLGVGLMEEFLFRGYFQYTAATGMGFWPAAVLTSCVFMALHMTNPGENFLGLVDVFLGGMFLCFTWWRTGDLWFAVGMHAAWDWGLSFLYSVPDSGASVVGHLFNVRIQGPTWLSGGTAGPEGSAINIVADVLYFAIFAAIFKQRRWFSHDKEPTSISNNVVLDSSALTR